jgi:hypothetical protein
MLIRKIKKDSEFRQQALRPPDPKNLYIRQETGGLFLSNPTSQLLLLTPVRVDAVRKINFSEPFEYSCFGLPLDDNYPATYTYSSDQYSIQAGQILPIGQYSSYSHWVRSLPKAPKIEPPENDFEIFHRGSQGVGKIQFEAVEGKRLSDIRIIFSRLSDISDNNLETSKNFYDTPYYSLNPTGQESQNYQILTPEGKISVRQFILKDTDEIILAPIIWIAPPAFRLIGNDNNIEYYIWLVNVLDKINQILEINITHEYIYEPDWCPASHRPQDSVHTSKVGKKLFFFTGQIFTLPYFRGNFDRQNAQPIPASGSEGWTIDPNRSVEWYRRSIVKFDPNKIDFNNSYNYPLYSKSARLNVADELNFPFSLGGGFPDIVIGWINRAGFNHIITETRG